MADDGAGDLGEALAGQETTFVAEAQKKTLSQGTLLVTVLLAACGGALYFMYARSGPSAAGAAETTATAAASTTINQFLTNGGGNVELMKQMLKDTEKVVEQFKSHPAKTQVPLTRLQTNPFRQNVAKTSAETQADAAAAAKKKLAEERKAVVAAAKALKLQSILHSQRAGSRKACMIDNKMYTEGDVVGGFTVERIAAGEVFVKQGKHRFKLVMKK